MNNGNDNYSPSYMNQTGVESSVNNATTPNSNMGTNIPSASNFVNNTKVDGALGSFNAPSASLNSRMLASDIGLNFLLEENEVKPVKVEETMSLPDKLEVETGNNEVKNEVSDNKTSKRIITILLIIIGILSIIIALLVLKMFSNKNLKVDWTFNERFSLQNVATSFFIKNNDEDYALFDIEGNKLSDFIYSKATSFFNNRSVVNSSGEVGVIDAKNNKIIDFGSYIDIENISGIFKVTNTLYREYLVDNDGNIIIDLKDKKILKNDNNNYLLIEDTFNKKYILFGMDGSELLTLSKKDDESIPVSRIYKNFLSFYYDNITYIYDMDSLRKITSFKSEDEYQINDSSDELIILSSINKSKIKYKFVIGNNTYDLSSICDEIIYEGSLICVKDNKSFLLKDNLEKGILLNDNASYFNSDSYVYDDGSSIYFYYNGELQNEVTCRNLISRGYSNNLYVLSGKKECGLSEEEYSLFDENGNAINDEVYSYVSKSDENGLYIVKTNDKFYLIDNKGVKIGNEYNNIEYSLGYYIVNDNLYGVIDRIGNTVIDLKYNSIALSFIRDNYYAVTDSDLEYSLYNISDNKIIYNGNTKPLINNNYILVIEDGKKKYYSYINGKEFYEV